jgi:hypothetical protein
MTWAKRFFYILLVYGCFSAPSGFAGDEGESGLRVEKMLQNAETNGLNEADRKRAQLFRKVLNEKKGKFGNLARKLIALFSKLPALNSSQIHAEGSRLDR